MQPAYAMFLMIFVSSLLEITYAQSVHLITVGDTGSFYDPQVVIARKGDIVSFKWTGMFHSVTQSSFAAPCTPLPGGFDSGVTGNPPLMNPTPEWNLTITDDTKPIWFFCMVSVPVPHCSGGMVGAINAVLTGTNESFDVFVEAAKTNATVPTFSSGVPAVLSGVGAMATTAPMPINIVANNTSANTTSVKSSLPSTSSTTPATQTITVSSRLSSGAKGGIAGGIVGAAVLVTLLVLLLLSYRRGRRYRKEAKENKILQSQSSRDMSHIERPTLLYGGNGGGDAQRGSSAQVGPLHRSQGSASIAESLEQDSTGGPIINVKELAAEIAKNIRQEAMAAERGRPTNEEIGLAVVPEQMVANAISRAESARSESTRGTTGRQLPRPPPIIGAKRSEDTHSVDTLPAYASGHR